VSILGLLVGHELSGVHDKIIFIGCLRMVVVPIAVIPQVSSMPLPRLKHDVNLWYLLELQNYIAADMAEEECGD
jgi:hypothetical protein